VKLIRLVSLGIVAVLKHRWGSRGTCWPGAFLSPGSSTWPRVRAAGCCSTPRPADASDLRGGQLRFDRAGGAVRGPGPRPLHPGGRLLRPCRLGRRPPHRQQGRAAVVRGFLRRRRPSARIRHPVPVVAAGCSCAYRRRVAPARARRNRHVHEGLLEEAGSVSHDRYQPGKEQYRYQQHQHRYTGAGKRN
jgi:hypothetical protein